MAKELFFGYLKGQKHLSSVDMMAGMIKCCSHSLMFGRDFKSNFIQHIFFLRSHKYCEYIYPF